jgi:hypothetical protein
MVKWASFKRKRSSLVQLGELPLAEGKASQVVVLIQFQEFLKLVITFFEDTSDHCPVEVTKDFGYLAFPPVVTPAQDLLVVAAVEVVPTPAIFLTTFRRGSTFRRGLSLWKSILRGSIVPLRDVHAGSIVPLRSRAVVVSAVSVWTTIFRLTDFEGALHEELTIHGEDGSVRVVLGFIGHESEPSELARFSIGHELYIRDHSILGKLLTHIFEGGVAIDIPDVDTRRRGRWTVVVTPTVSVWTMILSLIDTKRAPHEELTIQSEDGSVRIIFVFVRHESEPSELARFSIGHELYIRDHSILGKLLTHILRGGVEIDVPDVKTLHRNSRSPMGKFLVFGFIR